MIRINLSVLFILIFYCGVAKAAQGSLQGFVYDQETQAPLVGVNIMVEKTCLGAATDITGKFSIGHLPPGSYNVTFDMIGYSKLTKLNVPVNPTKSTRLDVFLEKRILTGDEVVVTGYTFTKSLDATVSDMNLDFTELMNDPGSAMDVQRMMQALPSVVSGTDENNEIIVRGGNPAENLFIIDNIEIPNPNHYGMQGEGGGPIGMIDPLFLQEIDFYAGAFPARFGGKAGSVMNIKLKEGSRDEFHGTFDMGMSGIGFNINGPFNRGRGSYILGFHKSYLDLIAGNIGLTAVPHYSNYQGKLVYDITPANKLIINSILGFDEIFIDDDEEINDNFNAFREKVDYSGKTHAHGLSLKTMINHNSYSLLTLSKVGKKWRTDVNEKYLNTGKEELIYRQKDTESIWSIKGEYFNRINEKNNLRLGFNIKAITFDKNEIITADTVWQYYYFKRENPSLSVDYPGINFDEEIFGCDREKILYIYPKKKNYATLKSWKPAFFAQYKYVPIKKMELNAGLRYSYFEYSKNSYLESRAGLSYHLTPATSLNFGYGKHFQEPSFVAFTNNIRKNKDLDSYYSTQFVAGIEHYFSNSFKATVEIYCKNYTDIPVSRQWLEADSIDFYDGEMVSKQKGEAKGIEIFLQKKPVKNFHFTLSYSHYISRYRDLRKEKRTWYTGSYDFRDVFTFIGGYKTDNRTKSWYRNLTANSWWKYVDWLISPGDELEVSMRFRYSQGRPYTQQHYDPYMRSWYTNYTTDFNTERLPAYNRLDLMVSRRWIYRKSSLVCYFNLMNLYNQKNIWGYSYNSDGSKEDILQYSFTPIGGFIWEF